MTGWGKLALGLTTALQVPATILLFESDHLDFTLSFLLLVLQGALAIYYLWDVGRNERVPEGTERLWRWAILLLGPLAEPVYFWNFIRGDD